MEYTGLCSVITIMMSFVILKGWNGKVLLFWKEVCDATFLNQAFFYKMGFGDLILLNKSMSLAFICFRPHQSKAIY